MHEADDSASVDTHSTPSRVIETWNQSSLHRMSGVTDEGRRYGWDMYALCYFTCTKAMNIGDEPRRAKMEKVVVVSTRLLASPPCTTNLRTRAKEAPLPTA